MKLTKRLQRLGLDTADSLTCQALVHTCLMFLFRPLDESAALRHTDDTDKPHPLTGCLASVIMLTIRLWTHAGCCRSYLWSNTTAAQRYEIHQPPCRCHVWCLSNGCTSLKQMATSKCADVRCAPSKATSAPFLKIMFPLSITSNKVTNLSLTPIRTTSTLSNLVGLQKQQVQYLALQLASECVVVGRRSKVGCCLGKIHIAAAEQACSQHTGLHSVSGTKHG